MSSDIVSTAGEPTMGGLEITNVSGSVRTVGNTTRYNERGSNGKFAARKSTEVGALGPPGGTGPGGVDAVTGRWIPGVRNHAELFCNDDGLGTDRVHTVGPSRAYFVAAEQEQVHAAESALNHVLGCPTCATGGMA